MKLLVILFSLKLKYPANKQQVPRSISSQMIASDVAKTSRRLLEVTHQAKKSLDRLNGKFMPCSLT